MNGECTHIWQLDHLDYFFNLIYHLRSDDAWPTPQIVFPAKCVCGKKKRFNQREWITHLEAQKTHTEKCREDYDKERI